MVTRVTTAVISALCITLVPFGLLLVYGYNVAAVLYYSATIGALVLVSPRMVR